MIRASGADIVGIEEGEHNAGVIAAGARLVRERADPGDLALPDRRPAGRRRRRTSGSRSLPGRFVAIGERPPAVGPVRAVRDPRRRHPRRGAGAGASTRLPAIQDQLAALPALAAAGMPTFLTGDFNSPSHLDWTAAVSAVRPEVPYPVDWPVSQALADAGFQDSYREIHPDPVAVPGFTWTPGGPESDPREVHDRIDWVLASGPATAIASTVVGEAGGPDVGIGVSTHGRPTTAGSCRRSVVRPAIPEPFVAVTLGASSPARRSTCTTDGGRDRPAHRDRPAGAGRRGGRREPAGRAARLRATEPRRSRRRRWRRARTRRSSSAGGAVLSRSPFWLYPARDADDRQTT